MQQGTQPGGSPEALRAFGDAFGLAKVKESKSAPKGRNSGFKSDVGSLYRWLLKQDSSIGQEERNSQNMNESTQVGYSQQRSIYLYYTTADETTLSSEVLIDFASFISAIGGNLGLFLGFSFMGMIFELYDWIEAKL